MSKLVIYFSFSGVTKRKAEAIAKKENADLFELKAQVPYTDADVNWQDTNSRNVLEHKDPTSRPAIEKLPDLKNVDEVWVGYPIWWYTHPRIIETLFDEADFTGKKVHLFVTSGGTGVEGSLKELKKEYPNVDFVDGKRV